MNAGEIPFNGAAGRALPLAGVLRRGLLRFAMATALAMAGPVRALDDPDAPDRTAAFLARAEALEERLAAAPNAADAAPAAAAYAAFLDTELNAAYQALLAQLDGPARRALVQSQRQWLHYRDAEVQFIVRHWTPQNFGSSSALSRAGYRASVVRQRVLTLLDYLRSYPAAAR